jgi:peroxiredoxin
MQRLRVLILASLASLALTPASLGAHAFTLAGESGPAAVAPGMPFPPMKVRALHPGDSDPKALDLGASLGKRPVVICYFSLGEPAGEETLLTVQKLAEGQAKGSADFFGATKPGKRFPLEQAVTRLSLLGVSIPVIVDEGFALGAALGVSSAPAISLIDAEGVLRVPEAKSLKQLVQGTGSMADAIAAAIMRRTVPTVRQLPRYYPVNELVGGKYADFTLKTFKGTERVKLSDHVGKGKKLTGLLFWHPNCTHCKVAMPSIMTAYRTYQKLLDFVSVVDIKNADEARNAQDTIKAHGLTFPVLEDEANRVHDLYKVVSTPTFVFVKPDGTVDSAYTSAEANYFTVIQARIRAVLNVPVGSKSGQAKPATAP